MNTDIALLTDLELIDMYCEKCERFINPRLFSEINSRGLYNIINRLPGTVEEMKSIARARLKNNGKYIGDTEIQQIADEIDRVKDLKIKLCNTPASEVMDILKIINEMNPHLIFVRDYYKSNTSFAQ